MATGFVQRFKGKIAAEAIALGRGGLLDAASGIRGAAVQVVRLSLPVTATANTDFTMSLPATAAVLSAVVYTTTAYGAATDAKIQIGSTVAGSDYVAAVSIKAKGTVNLALVAAAADSLVSLPAPPNLFIRIVQTGTASATGAAVLVVTYAMS